MACVAYYPRPPLDLWGHIWLVNNMLVLLMNYHSWLGLPNTEVIGIPIMDHVHLCQVQPHQQALPFSNCYSETTRICRTAHLPQQGPPMVFLIAAHNQWRLNFKYLVLLQCKKHQYTQYQCHANNNLLLQSQQRQQLYLPHIKNLMHQPQKFLAGTLKLWRTDLMLPLRRSWRLLLQL